MAEEHYKQKIFKDKKINLFFIFSVIIFFIFLVPTVSAFTFINVYIDSSGQALFLGETDTPVILPSGINNNNGEIVGKTQQLTSKQGEIWTFSYLLIGTEFNIILPEGAVLKQAPQDAEISLEDNRISLYIQDSIEIQYKVEEVPSSLPDVNIPLIIILVGIMIILIAFLINYTKRESKEEKKQENTNDKLKTIEPLLNEREKIIINKLKQTGKIKSSQLRKLTEIPKASFSRHVQELEKKKLLKRSGEGRNKFIELIHK